MKVELPREIKVTVIWDHYNMSMSAYSIYKDEIQMICEAFDVGQLNLMSIVEIDFIFKWIKDTFLRNPHQIHIDEIIY
jgi:hypothetical protein